MREFLFSATDTVEKSVTPTSARPYQITLGDTIDRGGEDYGTWPGETPELALLACLHESDPTREYETQHLSARAEYGRGAHTSDGSGNGAQDRSAWWYVTEFDGGRFAGVYAVAEAAAR